MQQDGAKRRRRCTIFVCRFQSAIRKYLEIGNLRHMHCLSGLFRIVVEGNSLKVVKYYVLHFKFILHFVFAVYVRFLLTHFVN